MPKVVGLRFRTSPKMYYFAPVGDESAYTRSSKVVVETQRGAELATVVMPVKEVGEGEIVAPLKNVTRLATEADLKSVEMTDAEKRDILATAREKAEARSLGMKIVDCEYTLDKAKLVLYFTAESRVDFRELVRELASAFRMRIDLRQISPRDECKLIGALGSCGMPCCCGRFESDGEKISIKMAKNQGLALTPNKINGMCGRLLCCLGYENKTYEEVIKRAPKHGAPVTAPDGRRGTVVSVDPLTEKVRVRIGDDENFEFAVYDLSELGYEKRVEEHPAQPASQPERNKRRNKNNRKDRGNADSDDGGEKNDRKQQKHDRRNAITENVPPPDYDGAPEPEPPPERGRHYNKPRNKNFKNKRHGGNNGGGDVGAAPVVE